MMRFLMLYWLNSLTSLCTVSDRSQDSDGMLNAAAASWLAAGAKQTRLPALLVELQVKVERVDRVAERRR